eukprot:358863-Chlamydomonas_euryale.AAC.2
MHGRVSSSVRRWALQRCLQSDRLRRVDTCAHRPYSSLNLVGDDVEGGHCGWCGGGSTDGRVPCGSLVSRRFGVAIHTSRGRPTHSGCPASSGPLPCGAISPLDC